eukprot:Skav212587  [mRNA]  locus=scaffold125:508940:509622:- [translate_table: standard]
MASCVDQTLQCRAQIYEMASDLCELQASQPDLLPQYIEQARRRDRKWISVSRVCKKWAWRVLDEFFEQGDEELAAGAWEGAAYQECSKRSNGVHGGLSR